MKKLIVLPLIIIALLAVQKNNGASDKYETAYFEVAVDSTFKIELKSNHSTGYNWQWFTRDSTKIVNAIRPEYIMNNPNCDGCWGKEVWTFKGLETGIDTFDLTYCRTWEVNQWNDTQTIIVKVL